MDEKKYFKKPERSEFVKASLPLLIPIVSWTFMLIPIYEFVKWLIWGHGPFVLFSDRLDIFLYLAVTSIFLLWEFKDYRNLYHKMRKTPFLVMTEKGVDLERELLPYWVRTRGGGKVELEWPGIRRIELEQNKATIYFLEKRKEESEKANLAWVEDRENLLRLLKSTCQEHHVEWIEK